MLLQRYVAMEQRAPHLAQLKDLVTTIRPYTPAVNVRNKRREEKERHKKIEAAAKELKAREKEKKKVEKQLKKVEAELKKVKVVAKRAKLKKKKEQEKKIRQTDKAIKKAAKDLVRAQKALKQKPVGRIMARNRSKWPGRPTNTFYCELGGLCMGKLEDQG